MNDLYEKFMDCCLEDGVYKIKTKSRGIIFDVFQENRFLATKDCDVEEIIELIRQ